MRFLKAGLGKEAGAACFKSLSEEFNSHAAACCFLKEGRPGIDQIFSRELHCSATLFRKLTPSKLIRQTSVGGHRSQGTAPLECDLLQGRRASLKRSPQTDLFLQPRLASGMFATVARVSRDL